MVLLASSVGGVLKMLLGVPCMLGSGSTMLVMAIIRAIQTEGSLDANQARSEISGLPLMRYLLHLTTSLDSIKGVARTAAQPELTRIESILDGTAD